ncbi:MAG: hypothetical protein ABW217_16760 [Polyangiaceae bacterium]
MSVLATFASGYPRLYGSDEAELAACLGEAARARSGGLLVRDPTNPELNWWPATVDFRDEAQRHGDAEGVDSFQALIDSVQRRRRGPFDAVYWFGHGAPSGELQFGRSSLGLQAIGALRNSDLSSRLRPGGAITFFACNAGQNQPFLQALADALRVRVKGFTRGLEWHLDYSGSTPHRHITRRGLANRVLPVPRIEASPRVIQGRAP